MKPNKLAIIAIIVSILALFVSSMSLYLSYQNSEHDRIVAYEQRKQALRQLFLEGEFLFRKLEEVILEHIKTDRTPELREHAAKIRKMVTELHEEKKKLSAKYSALPATSGTSARIELEELFAEQSLLNKHLLEMVDKAENLKN